MKISSPNRQLIYLGSSKKDAEKLPNKAKDIFAEAIAMALRGETHENAKMFHNYGSGVFQVSADHRNSTFREIYLVRFSEVVFVIHIFQKKSKKGIATPKIELETIKKRLKYAEQIYEAEYGKKNKR